MSAGLTGPWPEEVVTGGCGSLSPTFWVACPLLPGVSTRTADTMSTAASAATAPASAAARPVPSLPTSGDRRSGPPFGCVVCGA
ncbi:hypothetical protein DZF91_36885, partial [Actinomadura logoneensis]